MKNISRAVLLVLFALVLGLVPALQAAPADRYAAVAYSASTNRYGYGSNYRTKSEAIARARRECGPGSTFTNWCKNSWIALAISDRSRGGCGSGWGATPEAARQSARRQCLARNPDARVVVCVSAYSG
jgi:hypothetical protein